MSLQFIKVCSTALRSAVCRSDHRVSVSLRSGLWVIPPPWVFSLSAGVFWIILLLNHPDCLTSDSRTRWYEEFTVYWMNTRCPNLHPSTTVLTVGMRHWYVDMISLVACIVVKHLLFTLISLKTLFQKALHRYFHLSWTSSKPSTLVQSLSNFTLINLNIYPASWGL